MSAPRDVPVVLSLIVAVATTLAHAVAILRERSAPLQSAPAGALATHARALLGTDKLVIASLVAVGILALATEVRMGRRQLSVAERAKPMGCRTKDVARDESSRPSLARPALPPLDGMILLRRRALFALSLWAVHATLALWFMLRRPPEERLDFIIPCGLLLLPMRMYVQRRDGNAHWAPWSIGCATLVLAVTREPWSTWGLTGIAVVCYVCAIVADRRKRARSSRDSR